MLLLHDETKKKSKLAQMFPTRRRNYKFESSSGLRRYTCPSHYRHHLHRVLKASSAQLCVTLQPSMGSVRI